MLRSIQQFAHSNSQNKKPMNLGLYPKSKSYHGPEVFHPSPVYHKPTYHEPPVHHAKPHDLGRVKIQVRSSSLYSMLLKTQINKIMSNFIFYGFRFIVVHLSQKEDTTPLLRGDSM